MIRCGFMDGQDPPSPQSPILVACPVCNRKDPQCPACGGRGEFRVEQDPRARLPRLASRVAQLADLYLDHGLPPVTGGSLSQSNWFVDAAAFCVADRERMIADRYARS